MVRSSSDAASTALPTARPSSSEQRVHDVKRMYVHFLLHRALVPVTVLAEREGNGRGGHAAVNLVLF